MTKEEIKDQIDLDITNKTARNSVTPILVGTNIKNVVDLLPDLIMSYEGDLNHLTTPIFKDNVINIYTVTENFTYNTINLKIGNIVGLTPTLLIIIAENQKELLQNQLDAINSANSPSTLNPFVTQNVLGSYIKKINTTILPDINGNAIIQDANETTSGLVNFSGTQKFKGTKHFKMLGSTDQKVVGFLITDSNGDSVFEVRENKELFIFGIIKCNTVLSNTGLVQLGGAGTMGAVGKKQVVVSGQTKTQAFLGQNTDNSKRLTVDVDTGSVAIGSLDNNNPNTDAKFEVVSNTELSIPFPKMTYAQRNAIAGVNLVIGGGVYQTDSVAGFPEGLYLYKSTGWKKLAEV